MRVMRWPSVCPTINSEPTSRYYEISAGVVPLKVTRMPYFFNPVASTIPKWRAFKLLKWEQNCASLHESMGICMLIDLKMMNNFSKNSFVNNQKYDCRGRLNFKINVFFCGDNSHTWRHMKFGTVRYHRNTFKFYFHNCFVSRSF
jgi:hypothetical protein